MDFSFKYNDTNFSYDTIIKVANYLSVTSNYNIGNQTVYFTSFSITNFGNDTPLVKIRFNVLSGKFCVDDLNTVLVYLNGDACSVKIVECVTLPNAIQNIENKNASIDLYPNPSEGLARVNFNTNSIEPYHIIVSDVNGKMVFNQSAVSSIGSNEMNLNLDFLSSGVYIVQVVLPTINLHKKIVLQ